MIMPYAAALWDVDSDPFHVGATIAPAGVPFALRALGARMAGDFLVARRYAKQAMEADVYAIAEHTEGRIAKRSNIEGNAWSYWFQCFTGALG